MPLLRIPTQVETMLANGDFEVYFTLDVILGSGEIVHIADEALTGVTTIDFGSVNYLSYLREIGTMSESLTLASNTIDFLAQNVDSDLGIQVLGDEEALDGAWAIHSYVFVDSLNNKYQVEILHGEVQNAVDQDPNMQFQVVSHLCVDGSIGGHRTLQKRCFARYKIDERCASASPLALGCDLTLNGANGCDKHLPAPRLITPAPANNVDSYVGFVYEEEPLPGTVLAGPTGIVDGGNDFNSYWRRRQEVGAYTGRHEIPEYLVPEVLDA
jgi:hypothetical protein